MSATVPHTELVTVTFDGVAVQVPKGTLLVEAAKRVNTDIPVYCYHEKLGPAGLCRICLVEIEGMPKLQIACNTPVADGMKVNTRGPRVDDGRRAILEFFLLNHPLDCPICDKGGECDLQDYAMAWGQGASRMVDAKTPKPKAVDLGPTIVLDEERCIVCQRCVRFDQIITREDSLRTDDRGAHTIIATATGKPYVSDFTGNVTELCPVGALTSKTYRFRSRPWDNHRTTTTCTQCSVGCQQHVDERGNTILRTMSVTEDDALSDAWLCDRGRYNVGYVSDERRLTTPMLRRPDGSFDQIGWDDALDLWASKLREALASGGGSRVGVIGGGRLLNEEMALVAQLHRALGIENLDWRVGGQRFAHSGSFASHVDVENANVIVTIGRPPSQLAPVLDLRVRKAVSRNGATLISVGDHRARSFVPEIHVADAAALRDALSPNGQATAAFEKGKSIAVVWDGMPRDGDAALTALISGWTAAGKTVLSYVLPDVPNGRGADALGMRPGAGALDVRGMLEAGRDGTLAVLAVLSANPVLRFADRALAEAALRTTPFVVVTELFMTETAELADLVLPVCGAFEKSGTTTDLAGDVLPVVGSVRPPDDLRADGDIIVELAERLKVALPLPDDLDTTIRTRVRTAPGSLLSQQQSQTQSSGTVGSAQQRPLRVVAESAIFTGGGTLAHDAAIVALVAQPRAWVHPRTAFARGLVDGDVADVRSTAGVLANLAVVVDPRVPEDAVALLDGLPAAPLNALGASPLVTLEKALVLA